MRNRIAIIAALVCAAFALAVAGCGGGDESSSTTASTAAASSTTDASGTPLSKEEFIQQADAICKAGNQSTAQAANDLFSGGQPTQQQVDQFATDTLIPAIQDEIDQIGALTPPAGDEDDVQAILTAVSGALEKVKADPTALFASTDEGPFKEADQLASAYGLKVCGQG
jgi:hypothetical protein